MKKRPTHGGAREGAGRPAKETTQVMRVPLALVPKVLKMINARKKTP